MIRFRLSGRQRRLLTVATALAMGAAVAASWAWKFRLGSDPLVEAMTAYREGRYEIADRLAADRLRSRPDDREALRLRARAAARRGNASAARRLYASLGGAAEMKSEDLWLFGRIIDKLGDRETARDCWIQGLRADPNHPWLLAEIVADRLSVGRPIQAARFARKLADQPGWKARGEILLGKALHADDDPRGAVEGWSRAQAADPSMAGEATALRLLMARDFLRVGEPGRARALLDPEGQGPADPEAAWLLGRSFLQERSIAEAERFLTVGRRYRDSHPLEFEPAPYVGSVRCAECHAETARSLGGSTHGRTFRRSSDITVRSLPGPPTPDPGTPEVQHSIRKDGNDLIYSVRQGDKVVDAVVAYAFGSGDRGMTLVGRDERGRARELRLSLYEGKQLWDVTTGQSSPPEPGADYLGKILSDDELRSCFYCHTTVARSAREQTGPESSDPAIGCERCHGPGGHHLVAVASGFPETAIARPRPGSGPQVIALCGACHSPLGREVTRTDPLASRFPATSLTWSRCYTESGGALDCLTCHRPHRNIETSAEYYERKCLECHSGRPEPRRDPAAHASTTRHPTTCPVDPLRGCVKCHMPITRDVLPHTQFTDHFIRIPISGPGHRRIGG